MVSLRRNVLKCFLLLVLVAVMIFIYIAATVSLKEQGVVLFANTTKETVSLKSASNLSHLFGFGLSDTESENLLLQVIETERNRESEKLDFIHSKLKTTTRHSIKMRTSIPTAFHSVETVTSPSIIIEHLTNPVRLEHNLMIGDIPKIKVKSVNCERLIEGVYKEQVRADAIQKKHPKVIIPDEKIYEKATNCPKFISDRHYILKPVSDEEAKFPLAFSILLFQHVEQFERLLRAVYRPQNLYCIHVDKKSEKVVHDAVLAIVKCFENVFMAPEQFDVRWGAFSVLEPELSCMSTLLKYKKWRYFINLTGQEFPLKTNWEIVQILKIFNGANNLEGTVKRRNTERTATKPPTPSNITLTKGSVHIVATRKFIQYVIYNETSLQFREWVKDTYVPDETYFTSLNFNPHLQVPGSYLGIPETDTDKNLFITRFKNWGDGPFNWPCAGKRVRMVCIFAVRDLPLLASRVELFANKFYIDYEPLTLDCLEELHYNRTRTEILYGPDINRKFYENLDFVQNHL